MTDRSKTSLWIERERHNRCTQGRFVLVVCVVTREQALQLTRLHQYPMGANIAIEQSQSSLDVISVCTVDLDRFVVVVHQWQGFQLLCCETIPSYWVRLIIYSIWVLVQDLFGVYDLPSRSPTYAWSKDDQNDGQRRATQSLVHTVDVLLEPLSNT